MFLNDLRFAGRALVRRPGFTAVAVLTLALGIGANATIFSWIDALALDPVPVAADDDRLVALQFAQGPRRDLSFSYPNYVDVRDAGAAAFTGVAAYDLLPLSVRIADEPERVWGQIATANMFDVLGVPAALGRTLQPSDDRAPGASPVLVISDAYWRRRFAADPGVVGRAVSVNGHPFTIVGVAPRGFVGPMNGLAADAWLPMMMQAAVMPGDRLNDRGSGWMQAFARLAPGVTRGQAQTALDAIAARMAAGKLIHEDRRLLATPIWSDGAGAILLPILQVVMAVVVVVLLIACANVAGLLLARASGRRREIAVRLAIGASRGRIVRQLLVEAVLLATAAGAAAVLLTIWTSRLFMAFMPPLPFPVLVEGAVNWRVVGVAMAASLAAAVAFGLVPALAASRPALTPALKDSGGRPRARLRAGLVVAQIALSVVLLTGAGLFLRTLQHAGRIDPGFDARDGFFARLDLQTGGYDDDSGPRFTQLVIDRVEATPGVSRATLTTYVPLTIGGGSDTSARIEGYERAEGEQIVIYYAMVAPGYFETMGVPIVRGRGFTPRDTRDAAPAVIVNETMARRYWKDGEAIGRRLDFGAGGWATVVGIARNGKYGAINEPARNFMYIPLPQVFRTDVALVVRTAGEPAAVFPAVQQAVRSLNPNLPLFDVVTIEEHLRGSVVLPRLAAALLGLFGTLALGLAGVGLYGVMAFVAAQRTQEIGIRMALGANRADIRRLFLWHGLRLAVIGVLLGVGLASLLAPLLASQLVGVAARDVATFAATAGVLISAALLASYLPARRAAAVDPLRALRYE